MLQALRVCICGAGSKMSEAVKKQLVSTLQGLLSVPEDVSRMSAAGCLGALCQCLGDDDLSLLLNMHLLGNICIFTPDMYESNPSSYNNSLQKILQAT